MVDNPSRCCCQCFELKNPGDFAKCSKCSVYVYCNRECQSTSWKSIHKSTCKPHLKPPGFANLKISIPLNQDDDPDWDVPYPYIVVSPSGGQRMTLNELFALTRGIQQDEDLDIILNSSSVEIPEAVLHTARTNLCRRFNWPTLCGSSAVPGYRREYNGIALRAMHDDCFRSSTTLEMNIAAALTFMWETDQVKGTFVFYAHEVRPGEDGGEEAETMVRITRRQILSIAQYNEACCALGAVSERVHFENIGRAAALSNLKQMNFQMMNL